MKKYLIAISFALACLLFTPSHAHAQTPGYWTPAYVGYDAGCTTVGGVSGCVSALSVCQGAANSQNPNYPHYISNFVPIRHGNEYYECYITAATSGYGPVSLSCPAGQYPDPNSGSGCVTNSNQVMPPKQIGGGGTCPLPATAGSPSGPGQSGDGAPCNSEPIHNGDIFSGEPVDVATGNMFYQHTDYTTAGQNPLQVIRYYNSRGATYLPFGSNWRSNFSPSLIFPSSTQVLLNQADGRQLAFNLTGSVYLAESDVPLGLTVSGSNYLLTDINDTVETYNASGQLLSRKYRNGYTQTLTYSSTTLTSVTDSYGRTLTMNYSFSSGNANITSILTPEGTTISYGYTLSPAGENLTSVTYPTSPATSLTYQYTASSPEYNALTGVLDENGSQYLTWTYDNFGRALTSSVGNGSNANTTTFVYNDTALTTKVTNTLGVADTYSFTNSHNMYKVSGISRAATSTTAAASRTFTYDSNGYLSGKTDWNGNSTTYVNNANGQPTTINEAVGSPVARTTTIAYDPTWVHLPGTVTTPGLTIGYTYDSNGNQLTRKLTDTTTTTVPYSTNGQTRTWTNTWSDYLLASVETPNSHTTSFGYDSSGALTSITDALSHVTHITSHTGGGLPETIVDPNGVTTTISYDPRQRITSSSLATTAGGLDTTWAYFNTGDVTKTLPDGSALQLLLDSAHRLGAIANNFDEQTDWILDANGDPIETYINNASAATVFDRTATFDALGRKLKDTSLVTGASIVWTYDKDGNPLTIADPLSHTTTNVFDGLSRLSTSTDANTGVVTLTYNAHNKPLTVKDKNGNTTSYVYDGFGDVIQQTSPDSGTTVYHYDSDGNLTSKTDAASVVTNLTYDALDRRLTTTYPADSAENVTFTYDQTGHGFGIGRLTSVTDAAGSLSFTYDERGNTLTSKRTNGTNILTTTYTFDKASRVASITYPSGATVTYARDAVGQIQNMPFAATGTDLTDVAVNITHLPFGPANSWEPENGDRSNLTFDLDYRLTNIAYNAYPGTTSFFNWTYAYDNANNVSSITDNLTAANSQAFTYDILNRLHTATSSGTYGSLAWVYDKNGNLTSHTLGSTVYTDATTSGTNRLSGITWTGNSESVGYTATGNISTVTLNGSNSYTLGYNKANRFITATGGSVSLAISGTTYDFAGKRITKSNPGSNPTIYTYDLDGNLIEENDNGTATDYIYMDGMNIGNWQPSESHLYMINPDGRGVPQVSRDEYGLTNWAAYSQPYGTMTQTVATGAFTGPVTEGLRLPGQYYDHEIGFHHNGFRDYIPSLGRYIESDPIGLGGGLNTYAYVAGMPVTSTDALGLADPFMGVPPGLTSFPASAYQQPPFLLPSVPDINSVIGRINPNFSYTQPLPYKICGIFPTVVTVSCQMTGTGDTGSCYVGAGVGIGGGTLRVGDSASFGAGGNDGFSVQGSISSPSIPGFAGGPNGGFSCTTGGCSLSGGLSTAGGNLSGRVTAGYRVNF